jgi:hypothetical protein
MIYRYLKIRESKIMEAPKKERCDYVEIERVGREKLIELLNGYFDFKCTYTSCLADLIIRPCGVTDDKWLMIQLKVNNWDVESTELGFITASSKYPPNMVYILVANNHNKSLIYLQNEIKDIEVLVEGESLDENGNKIKYPRSHISVDESDHLFSVSKLYELYDTLSLIDEYNGRKPRVAWYMHRYDNYMNRPSVFSFLKFEDGYDAKYLYSLCNGLKLKEVAARKKGNSYPVALLPSDNAYAPTFDILWVDLVGTDYCYIFPKEIVSRKCFYNERSPVPKGSFSICMSKEDMWYHSYRVDKSNIDIEFMMGVAPPAALEPTASAEVV